MVRTNVCLSVLLLLVLGCGPESAERAQDNQLPYYQDPAFTPQWISEASRVSDEFHRIPEFSLVNQAGEAVTEKNLEGKVYVANFFFGTCSGICPKTMANMRKIQESLGARKDVRLVSHSVTPDHDSVEMLRGFADAIGVRDSVWDLLTGDRDQIYDLGRNFYFAEDDLGEAQSPDSFIHTENFFLIDETRRIRGVYNGLNSTAVAQLLADIDVLTARRL